MQSKPGSDLLSKVSNIPRKLLSSSPLPGFVFGILSPAVVIYIETGRQAGTNVPLPFLLLYASAILAAYLGGFRVGVWSGLVSAGFVVYANRVGFGPATLTGGWFQVGMGVLLYLLSPILLGRMVKQRNELQQAMLAQQETLENLVNERTRELEAAAEFLDKTNTQYEQAEQRYRLLFNNTLEAIVVHRDGVVLEINPSFEALSGFSYDELIGDNIFRAIPKAKLEEIQAGTKDISEQPYESYLHCKDGKLLSVEYQAREIIYEGQEARLVAIRDLTARKAFAKQELELALHRERVKVLEEVVSDLSHDIKTPLASIKTSVHLLRKQPEDPERYLNRLDTQVERLNKLVDDVLAMSRLDKGANLTFEAISLDELTKNIQSLLADFRHRFEEKQLDFQEEFESSGIQVMSNSTELMRAIANLIDNAITYSEKGGSIRLATLVKEQDCLIRVSDNGIGISADDQARIFERFYRADKARSTSEAGTGLGLAITNRVIELHGGWIELESEIGKGSTFTIYLPQFSVK